MILRAWHQLVDADPELTTASSISRTQFYDHIPQLLDAFCDLLCAQDLFDKKQATAEQKKSAGEHGLHRWQQGYNQSQTMREWAHLHLCLLDELDHYAAAQPSTEELSCVSPGAHWRDCVVTAFAKVRPDTRDFSKSRLPPGFATWSRRSSICKRSSGSEQRGGVRPRMICAVACMW